MNYHHVGTLSIVKVLHSDTLYDLTTLKTIKSQIVDHLNRLDIEHNIFKNDKLIDYHDDDFQTGGGKYTRRKNTTRRKYTTKKETYY